MDYRNQQTPLPSSIFGINTQDALKVCLGLAMATIGIKRIINSINNG